MTYADSGQSTGRTRKGPLADRVVAAVLSSRAHGLLSGSVALLTVTGLRSGAEITFPVMYAASGSEVTVLVGDAERKTWWRNLDRIGTPVRVLIAGVEHGGIARVIDGRLDPTRAASALRVWLERFPAAGGRLGAGRLRGGRATPAQLAKLAAGSVLVRIELGPVLPLRPLLSRTRWTVACLLGEAVGIGVAAGTMAALGAADVDGAGTWTRWGAWALVVLAGVVEGVALGGLQWRALRRKLPALPARRFVGATVAVAALGWAVGMLPSTLSSGGGSAGSGGGPPGWAVVLLSALGGLAAGAVFGAAQAWALRGYAGGRRGWIGVNAVGWAGALAWIGMVAAVPGSGWPFWSLVLLGLVAGCGSGMTVGLVTGTWLPRLRPVRQPSR